MNNNITERRSSSVSPNVISTMVIPKCEPIENEFNQNNKRQLGEYHSNDSDPILSTKRQMATKKSQQTDTNSSKFHNGRNDSIDDQQRKQADSPLLSNSPKISTSKLFTNGGSIEISTSPSNVQVKPR